MCIQFHNDLSSLNRTMWKHCLILWIWCTASMHSSASVCTNSLSFKLALSYMYVAPDVNICNMITNLKFLWMHVASTTVKPQKPYQQKMWRHSNCSLHCLNDKTSLGKSVGNQRELLATRILPNIWKIEQGQSSSEVSVGIVCNEI